MNPAACSLLGYERQELLKMRPWDFATSASWEGILALIGTMELGDPVTVQRAYRCKSGEQKIVDVRLTRENHAGRDLIVVFSRDVTEQKRLELRSPQNGRKLTESQRFTKPASTAMDITEGTKIEEALKRSQEYLRLTIDTIPTFAWCNRPDGSNEFLTRIVHSGFLFRRVPEISVLIRVGESATFGAYHVWREHRECRLAFVA